MRAAAVWLQGFTVRVLACGHQVSLVPDVLCFRAGGGADGFGSGMESLERRMVGSLGGGEGGGAGVGVGVELGSLASPQRAENRG